MHCKPSSLGTPIHPAPAHALTSLLPAPPPSAHVCGGGGHPRPEPFTLTLPPTLDPPQVKKDAHVSHTRATLQRLTTEGAVEAMEADIIKERFTGLALGGDLLATMTQAPHRCWARTHTRTHRHEFPPQHRWLIIINSSIRHRHCHCHQQQKQKQKHHHHRHHRHQNVFRRESPRTFRSPPRCSGRNPLEPSGIHQDVQERIP